MKKYQKKNNTSWHVKSIWNSNFALQIWSFMGVQPLSPYWPWLALCNTSRAEGVQKRSCDLQVLKHLLSDPLLKKKKKSLSRICFLLKMRKLKPKEIKDIRVIQLVFGRQWSESEVTHSCPTLWDPMDCSLSGSNVHGIFQARVLEWIAISFSRVSSRPRIRT